MIVQRRTKGKHAKFCSDILHMPARGMTWTADLGNAGLCTGLLLGIEYEH